MSLIDVISSLGTPGPYTVRRTGAGSWVKGRWETAGSTTSEFTITAVVVPTQGAQLMDDPESQHVEEQRTIYTSTALTPRSHTVEPDVLVMDDVDWLVIGVRRWQAFGETFYVCEATRLGV